MYTYYVVTADNDELYLAVQKSLHIYRLFMSTPIFCSYDVILIVFYKIHLKCFSKCDPFWENQSYCPCQQIQFFIMNRMVHDKLINFIFKTSYTWVVCFCWLLYWSSVAICTSGPVSKWSFGQSWDGHEWLHSSVVLNKGVCCKFPFILASSKACEAHNLADASLHLSLQKF